MHPLRKWLARKGMTAMAFSEATGLDQASLCRIMQGQTGPSLGTAFIIEDATKGAVKARQLAALRKMEDAR